MACCIPNRRQFVPEFKNSVFGELITAQNFASPILRAGFSEMTKGDLFNEIIATYEKHGWTFKVALLCQKTLNELPPAARTKLTSVELRDSPVDALWFSRPSHHNREAWELRLLSETQYALFESFEPEETEEQRAEMRDEMEAKLRDYVSGGS